MNSLEVYMKESGKMVARLGFWSEEFKMFREWWQQRGRRASKDEVERMADSIWRKSQIII